MAMQAVAAAAKSLRCSSLGKFVPKIWGDERHHRLACCSWTVNNSPVSRSLQLQACNLSAKSSNENFRPLANFRPTLWKDTFSSIQSPNSEVESYDNKVVEELKEKVKEMLIASTKDPVKTVSLIDSLCRLGVSYHFETEIEEQLNRIFESHANLADDHDYDLHTIALLFRVLRQHGYKMSCDVFNKFKDNDNGVFKESLINHVKGMLSLYEATHLRIHNEDILEEALAFTTAHLKFLATKSSPYLAKHIIDALEQPLHKGVPRIEAYKYISFYEQEECINETLLMFGKLDFNRVQLLHQQELSHLTSWWKDLKLKLKLSYARDRIVEIYFWTVAEYFEPCYSHARLMNTKILVLLTLIDDTFDAYGTLEELRNFTEAVQRWETNALVDQLPNYMKILYGALLNFFDELDNDLTKQGISWRVSYVKDKVKEMVRAYLVEVEWFGEGLVPEFDEHLRIALITAGCFALPASSFLGMGEIAGIEAFEWLQSNPKIIRAAFLTGRLLADIVSHEFEQKRGHVASSVECYMKQYGLSRKETIEEFKRMSGNAWKDLNEECMRPTVVPMQLLTRVVSFARIGEVFYKKGDGITDPQYLEDYITKLFIHKIPI